MYGAGALTFPTDRSILNDEWRLDEEGGIKISSIVHKLIDLKHEIGSSYTGICLMCLSLLRKWFSIEKQRQ